ncbi:SAC3 family protein 1 [Paramyrothecium foliicola]|nr:SAC3 family protein 1 [Paramyrothecium foliicola]
MCSGQTMSPFSQPTNASSPASNPFAPRSNPFASQTKSDGGSFGTFGKPSDAGAGKFAKRKHPLAQEITFDSDEDRRKGKTKPKHNNPFLSDDASGDDAKKKGSKRLNHGANGSDKTRHPGNASARNGTKGFGSNGTATPQPFAATPSQAAPVYSNDPHAKKVYDQLHKDGINPPQWPSQPGNPSSKAQMAKFREQYEAYREKVRASLTKAGIIDDPEKRKTLQDAIDFKGICEDMCPEYEKIQRITELDVHQPEKDASTTYANTARMIKKLARSAAGQEAPLPMDVRSVAALRRTLDYLIDDLLRDDGNLPVLHGFLWDRTRAIRRDFTFFSALNAEELKSQVYVLENIARFHVTALHLLSQEGVAAEDFVEQQELEQLGKALLSLRDVYDDCDSQGIVCENEAEFRAYYLIFHANDPNIMETLQRQWRPSLWRDSDEVRTAVSLVESLQNTDDFHGPLKDAPSLAASGASHAYFRIMRDPSVSYTMACFAECHLPHLRRSILKKVKRALARPKETAKDVTAGVLNKFLQFDTVQQAIDFAELHDLQFGTDNEAPSDPSRRCLILNNKAPLPHPRLQHQFSRILVENKRGSAPLPKLIHQSILDSGEGGSVASKPSEKSLFVKDTEPNAFAKPSSGGFGISQPSSGFSQTPDAFKAPSFAFPSAPQGASPFAPASSSPTPPASNPFAPAAQPPSTTPSASPFAPSSFNAPTSTPPTLQSNKESNESKPLESQPAAKPAPFDFLSKPASAPPAASSSSPFAAFSASKPSLSSSEAPAPGLLTGPASTPFTQPPPSLLPQASAFLGATAPGGAGLLKPTASPFAASTPEVPSSGPKDTATPKPGLSGSFDPKPASSLVAEGSSHVPGLPQAQPVPSTVPSLPGQIGLPPSQKPLPLAETPKPASSFNFPNSSSTSKPATPVTAQPLPHPTQFEPKKPAPPQDLLGDFTKWFVLGDDGLMEQFNVYMIEDILTEVFQSYHVEKEELARAEEEERLRNEADEFRTRSLSVRYFYLWRDIARERRLRELRRSGREQLRAYQEAQRAAKLRAQEEAAREAARERKQIASLDRTKEMRDMLGSKKLSKRKAEKALLASGVLSGVGNEQEAIAAIVGQMSDLPDSGGSSRQPSQSPSEPRRKEGAKTKALRELYQPSFSGSFRRSLPAMSSRSNGSPARTSPTSRASERWRLKAMGIVQLPDGTAVPESLANDVAFSKSYSQLGHGLNGASQRRASISSAAQKTTSRNASGSHPLASVETDEGQSLNHKRKRPADDEGDINVSKSGSSDTAHKRVMSETENTINELRALRAELEEGTAWFKTQNERLRGEITSRGSTPY